MKKNLLYSILFILSLSSTLMAEDCSPYIGSCSYYLCREKEHACGTKGYYLGFAYKYCQQSVDKLNAKMSEQGKTWSKNVAICLQQSVEKIPYEDNCSDVKKSAINEHVNCYKETGFCELSKRDQLKVIWMVHRELRHPQIMKEGFSIVNECR